MTISDVWSSKLKEKLKVFNAVSWCFKVFHGVFHGVSRCFFLIEMFPEIIDNDES